MEFLYCKKQFMQRCIAKNLTDNTLRAYEEFFRSIQKYLTTINRMKDFENVTASDIRGYFIEASKTMKGITQVGYHRRLTTFYNFLVNDGILTDNVMKRVETTKIYVTLTDTEKAQQNARYNPLDNRRWEYY